MNWRDLQLRLRALTDRRRVEEELDEELHFHIAMQTRKNLDAGMSEADAKRSAAAQFGGMTQTMETCRDTRGVNFLETLWLDLRHAARGFRRTPGFAVTVVATIALGLGLNTSLFTVFNAYVLRPLAVRDPYGLYQFTWSNRHGDGHIFTWKEFQDFQKENPAFSEVVADERVSFARVDGHLMMGHLVTGNFFQMVGVNALLGRTLIPEDSAAPGSRAVAVLSFTAWTNKFGRDPEIVGKKIVIHGYPLEVVGVARADFRGLGDVPLDYWVPVTMAAQLEDGPSLFGPEQPKRITVIGRLRRGISRKQAQAALTLWAQQRTGGGPDPEKAVAAILRSKATVAPPDPMVLAAFSPILVGFGLVLVIACANVTNMMLARSMARQREIGIRLAMGAARRRLVRQLLTESLLLTLPAAAAGFLVSQQTLQWGQRVIMLTMPGSYLEFVTLEPLTPDARVFCFLFAAAIGSGLLFGLTPALQATRSDVMRAVRGEVAADLRPFRMRNALVIGQVTVSVVLLVCAAMLLRVNHRMQSLDVGLRTQDVIELDIQDKLRAGVIRQLGSETGIDGLAAASNTPFTGSLPRMLVVPNTGSDRYRVGYLYASPEYFPMFHLPILRGRDFTREEAAGPAAVAIVSQATARWLWPGKDALGQRLRIARDPNRSPSLADPKAGAPGYASVVVIGITRDAVNGWVGDGTDHTCVFFPTSIAAPGNTVFARVHGDVEAAQRRLDTEIAASAPGALDQIHSMDEILAGQLYPFRALYWMSSAVGGLALLLTLSGIYGVLAYAVTQRTKEIGIRVALGATPRGAAWIVLGQSLRISAIGAGIGALGSLGAMRLAATAIDNQMFGSFDMAALGIGLALALGAAAAAAWIPARRAARIEAIDTLRCD